MGEIRRYQVERYWYNDMHSIKSIVGIVLTSKENYPEWLQKSNTLSFLMSYGKECLLDKEMKRQSSLP